MAEVAAGLGLSLFGGVASKAINKPDNSAQREQLAQNERIWEHTVKKTGDAELVGMQLFDAAQQNLLTGNRAAFNLQRDVLPVQTSAYQQGNLQAQQQISGALPQYYNALMGFPVDYGAFQPQTFQPDLSIIQQQQAPVHLTPEQQQAMQNFNRGMALVGGPQFNAPVMQSPLTGVQAAQAAIDAKDAKLEVERQAKRDKQAAMDRELQKLIARGLSFR